MANENTPESQANVPETTESFKEILTEFEQSRSRRPKDAGRQLQGTVITVSADSVILDIGFKSEGILPISAFQGAGESVKPGDQVLVSVKGRDPEGYYELTRFRTEQPKDWSSLERAFAEKAAIVGTVSGVIKGGLSVDVGVRAFMPASRTGARDAAEMEKLVGQEIRCRIIKLDVADEDVVVDRRALAEEEERTVKDRRYSELKEGDAVRGAVRSLTSYGAFVDIGGVDALLACQRYQLEPGKSACRCANRRPRSRGQGPQDRLRQTPDFHWDEAASTASLGRGWTEVQRGPAHSRYGHARG